MNRYDGSVDMPGKCFICERAYEPGELATFPGFQYEPDFNDTLYGAKSVCDNCVGGLAEVNGYISRDEYQQTVTDYEADLEALIAERDALKRQQDEGVEGLMRLFERTKRAEAKAKPAPRPRKPSVSPEA